LKKVSVIFGRLETYHAKLMYMCTVPLLPVVYWLKFMIEV